MPRVAGAATIKVRINRLFLYSSQVFPHQNSAEGNQLLGRTDSWEGACATAACRTSTLGVSRAISRSAIFTAQDSLSKMLTIACIGYHNSSPQQRFPGDGGGYYSNRMSYSRPESYVDTYSNQPGQYNQGRRFGPRNASDPALYGNNNQGVYPTNGYQQSYDTVTSASGTGSHATDQWGNSTDPSSENSSIDKIQQAPKPEPTENYGLSGFGGSPQFQGPILEEYGTNVPAYGHPGYGRPKQSYGGAGVQGNGFPPAPPPHLPAKDKGPRVPMKLGNPMPPPPTVNGYSHNGKADQGEKRKSWLKRRFSKNN